MLAAALDGLQRNLTLPDALEGWTCEDPAADDPAARAVTPWEV